MLTGWLVVFAAAAVLATASTVTEQAQNDAVKRQQTSERAQRKRELRARYPTTDFDTPEVDKMSLRAKRGKDFERQGFAIKDNSPSGVEEVFENEWSLHTPPLPVAQSDGIVIGEVLDAQAHLSHDKTGIYSEFNFRVDGVLKDGRNSLPAGQIIPVARVGGRVRYANGHSRLYRIGLQNMPRLGARYVLFLRGSGGSDIYHILTGYELSDQKITPLDEPAQMKAYDQMDENTFIETVRNQVMQLRSPGRTGAPDNEN